MGQMRMPPIALPLASLLVLAGCVRTFEGGPGDQGADRRADLNLEQADRGGVDSGSPDRADLVRTDRAPSVPCIEAPFLDTAANACSQQCLSTSDDKDCDGLPGARDPVPDGCNRLLSFDLFGSSAVSSKWTPGGTVSWPCGSASLGVNGTLKLSAGELAKIPSGKFLIEAKYTLGPKVTADWGVYLHLGKPTDPTSWFSCEQWVDATHSVKGSVHLTGNWCTNFGSWSQTAYDVSPGKTYYLQLYSDGAGVYCRVGNEQIGFEMRTNLCALSAPGELYLLTTREITVDHLLIFQY